MYLFFPLLSKGTDLSKNNENPHKLKEQQYKLMWAKYLKNLLD
jgi:hypothetical protein